MNALFKPVSAALFLLLSCSVTGETPGLSGFTDRLAEKKARFVSGAWPAKGDSVRDASTRILECAETGFDPDFARSLLSRIETERDASSGANSGNLSWYFGDHEVRDANAVEFVAKDLSAALFALNGNAAAASLRGALIAAQRKNLVGIDHHQVSLAYTNIILMKAWNLLSIGQLLPDGEAFAEGKKILGDWIAQIGSTGVREYLSPCYSAVDLENLSLIALYIQDESVRSHARRGLDFLWAQSLAFWYGPSVRLGGTHSRDYDRLTGHDALDRWLLRALAAGDQAPARSGAIPGEMTAMEIACWMPPSPEVLDAFAPEANGDLLLRWDASSFVRQWRFREKDSFGSLSTANALYANMDTSPLSVNLGGGAETPSITVTMNGRPDYYGVDRIPTSTGHPKSLHLTPFVAASQDRNRALVLLSGNGGKKDTCETTVLLPADCALFLNGKPLEIDRARSSWFADPAVPDGSSAGGAYAKNVGGKTVVELSDRTAETGVGLSRFFTVTAGSRMRTVIVTSGGPVMLYHTYYDASDKIVGGERMVKCPGSAVPERHEFGTEVPSGAVRMKARVYSSIASVTECRIHDLSVERLAAGTGEVLYTFDFTVHVPSSVEVRPGDRFVAVRDGAALALIPLAVRTAGKDSASFGDGTFFVLSNDGLTHGALRLTARQSDPSKASAGQALTLAYAEVAAVAGAVDGSAVLAFVADIETRRFAVSVDGLFVRAAVSVDTVPGIDAPARRSPGLVMTDVGPTLVGPLSLEADCGKKTASCVPAWPEGNGLLWIDGTERALPFFGSVVP